MRCAPWLVAVVGGITALGGHHGGKKTHSGVHAGNTPPLGSPKLDKPPFDYSFPSEADTLAYVDALKHSDLSEWRSLEEVAARAGGGSCSGAVTTSVLTALYLLGLFNLCAASPVSCCMPPVSSRRRRRRSTDQTVPIPLGASLPPILNNHDKLNLSNLSLDQFNDLPHVTTADGGRVPVHVSVVEQVRKLWDSNPRLLSSVTCKSATESVRSSFISLSGVASGIILAYSVAQLSQCYSEGDNTEDAQPPKIWFFDLPKPPPDYLPNTQKEYHVPSLPGTIPILGENEEEDGCDRTEVPLEDGRCAPLLSPAHCPYHHWVLLNRNTMKGECVPQLCNDGRVFVENDEMCHHIDEYGLCPRNQRLYITATGHAVCDCPDGMFQGPYGNCYHLYETAYCSKGLVLQFHKPSQSLSCQPDPCGHVNANLWQDDLPYAPSSDGFCYQFNADKPCGKGKRFGFDTEELEAECVSLVDAGLVRPRRSYMYHHMSFPSSPDQEFPHYQVRLQVSYVILNGTTWGLEVKGVGRDKRSTSSTDSEMSEQEIHFIDTRDIPGNLSKVLNPPTQQPVEQQRQRQHKRKQILGLNSKRKRRKPLIHVSQNSSKKRPNRHKNRRQKLHNLKSKVLIDKERINKSNKLPKNQFMESKKEYITKLNEDKVKNTDEPKFHHMDKFNVQNKQNLVKIKSKSADKSQTKKTRNQNTDKMNKQSIQKLLQNVKNLDPKHIVDDLIPNKEKQKEIFKNILNNEDKIQKSVTKLSGQKLKLHKKNDPTELKNITKHDNKKILRKAVKEEMKRILDKKQLREGVRNAIKAQLQKNNSSADLEDWDEKQNIHNKGPQKSSNSKNSDDIIKVDQKDDKSIQNHQTSNKKDSSSNQKLSTGKVQQTITSRKSRRKTGKELRRGKRKKLHRKRGRRKRRKGHGLGKFLHRYKKPKRKKRKKKKNPDLPYRVATKNTISTKQSPKSTNKTTPYKVMQKIEQTKVSTNSSITNQTKIDVNEAFIEINRDSDVNDIISGEETSLPDYLRHRGRRQLGGGGGIIQAPLLSACKPGAKRDYNYKCRAKFIPQERNRRDSEDPLYVKETSPNPPRIKCPKGTRLDPRGQCQTTSSKLG